MTADMTKEAFFHDWLVTYLQGRLARDYKDIQANYQDNQQHHRKEKNGLHHLISPIIGLREGFPLSMFPH